jgi:hypothetical protein
MRAAEELGASSPGTRRGHCQVRRAARGVYGEAPFAEKCRI